MVNRRPGTQVRALRFVMRTGERTLQQGSQDTTDDRGMYRIYQLQPGEYIVNALPRNMTAGDLRQTLATEISTRDAAGSGRWRRRPRRRSAGLAAGGRAREIGGRLAELQQQLSATEQEQSTAYAPVYYPGTTSASAASTVTLGVGEERSSVDFQLQLVPTSRVGGLVVSPDGALPQGTQVALVPTDRGSMPAVPGLSNNVARVGGDGRFTFNNVTPGQYLLQARATIRQPVVAGAAAPTTPVPGGGGRAGGPGGPGAIAQVLWASSPVEVGTQAPPDTVLNLQPGMTVERPRGLRGGSDADGRRPDPRAGLAQRARRADVRDRRRGAARTGGCVWPIFGHRRGPWSILALGHDCGPCGSSRGPAGAGRGTGWCRRGTGWRRRNRQPATQWQLKSALADGRDLLDFPVDIGPGQDSSNIALTFTERSQELSGTIQDATGRPTSDFTIIVFTPDNRYWLPQARRIGATRPGTDGRFTFRGLPAGDYRLTAVTDVEPGEWYDPAFLTQLSAVSIPVNVGEGEKKVQDIRLAGGQ